MNLKDRLIEFAEFLNSVKKVKTSEFEGMSGFGLLPNETGLIFIGPDNQELFAVECADGTYRTVIENTEPTGSLSEVAAELFLWSMPEYE